MKHKKKVILELIQTYSIWTICHSPARSFITDEERSLFTTVFVIITIMTVNAEDYTSPLHLIFFLKLYYGECKCKTSIRSRLIAPSLSLYVRNSKKANAPRDGVHLVNSKLSTLHCVSWTLSLYQVCLPRTVSQPRCTSLRSWRVFLTGFRHWSSNTESLSSLNLFNIIKLFLYVLHKKINSRIFQSNDIMKCLLFVIYLYVIKYSIKDTGLKWIKKNTYL